MIESAEFNVEVTVTFKTWVDFAPIERSGPITDADALANFYGSGLDDILSSVDSNGEYAVEVTSEKVERL